MKFPQPPVAPDGMEWRELFRYANGEWVKADGTPDIAFGGKSSRNIPYLISYEGPRGGEPEQVRKARREGTAFVSSRYGAANGRRVDETGAYTR